MLQIIGWILCAMLLVKALELFDRHDSDKRDDDPYRHDIAKSGGWLAVLAAVGFAFWLFFQGRDVQRSFEPLSEDPAVYENLTTSEAAADAAVDPALEAAERAVERARQKLDDAR